MDVSGDAGGGYPSGSVVVLAVPGIAGDLVVQTRKDEMSDWARSGGWVLADVGGFDREGCEDRQIQLEAGGWETAVWVFVPPGLGMAASWVYIWRRRHGEEAGSSQWALGAPAGRRRGRRLRRPGQGGSRT